MTEAFVCDAVRTAIGRWGGVRDRSPPLDLLSSIEEMQELPSSSCRELNWIPLTLSRADFASIGPNENLFLFEREHLNPGPKAHAASTR